jgi:hypothetical protein
MNDIKLFSFVYDPTPEAIIKTPYYSEQVQGGRRSPWGKFGRTKLFHAIQSPYGKYIPGQ